MYVATTKSISILTWPIVVRRFRHWVVDLKRDALPTYFLDFKNRVNSSGMEIDGSCGEQRKQYR